MTLPWTVPIASLRLHSSAQGIDRLLRLLPSLPRQTAGMRLSVLLQDSDRGGDMGAARDRLLASGRLQAAQILRLSASTPHSALAAPRQPAIDVMLQPPDEMRGDMRFLSKAADQVTRVLSRPETEPADGRATDAGIADFVTDDAQLPALLQDLLHGRVPLRMRHPADEPVLVVGASAGGVTAFRKLLSQPDVVPEMPIVLLLHRRRRSIPRTEQLSAILRASTTREVRIPEDGEEPRSGVVYLPRDQHHLLLKQGRFSHQIDCGDGEWCPSIDTLFGSAARSYGPRTIAALLTGRLSDGVQGLRDVTAYGGVTIVQTPSDAESPSLPIAAIEGDHPNYLVPVHDLMNLLREITQVPFPRSVTPDSLALRCARAAADARARVHQDRGANLRSRLGLKDLEPESD